MLTLQSSGITRRTSRRTGNAQLFVTDETCFAVAEVLDNQASEVAAQTVLGCAVVESAAVVNVRSAACNADRDYYGEVCWAFPAVINRV